jgi:hypothetical protein
MNRDRVRDLAGAEVMSWNVNAIPVQVAESQGPLRVMLRGETVRLHPWHTHPEVRQGVLYVLDILHGGRVLAEYRPGEYDVVERAVELRGLY